MNYIVKDRTAIIDVDSLFYYTVQQFMDDLIPSRKMQHLIITNGWLRMDEIKVKRETILDGQKLYLDLYPETYEYTKIENDDIEIVYEDELLLVVNKPAGLLVHSDTKEITLNDKVQSYFRSKNYYCLNPIHRLDKETSGLIVYSKSPVFQPLLDKYLNEKQIQRFYLAFVKGASEKGKKYSIDSPLGRDRHDSKKMIVYKNGQEAHTKAVCIASRNGFSVMQCHLLTGRTHQIRVHLSSIGFPILNDALYGVNTPKFRNMGLMATELRFYQPLKQEEIKVKIDCLEEYRVML